MNAALSIGTSELLWRGSLWNGWRNRLRASENLKNGATLKRQRALIGVIVVSDCEVVRALSPSFDSDHGGVLIVGDVQPRWI